MNDEMVLCLKNAPIEEMAKICRDLVLQSNDRRLAESRKIFYFQRSVAEHDERFRQIIPYVVFERPQLGNRPYILTYERGDGVGEQRLRRLRSCGIGGHVRVGVVLSAHFSASTRPTVSMPRGSRRQNEC